MSKQATRKATTKRQAKPTGRQRFVYFSSALVAVAVLVFVSRLQPVANAITLATTRQPEGYTELWFNASAAHPLPSSAPAGKATQFSFHIANHETRSVTYRYLVTLAVANSVAQIGAGTVTLGDGKSADVTSGFTMPVPSATGLVGVQLVNPAQHIFFRTYS
jgi:uncharacterized membrane protein